MALAASMGGIDALTNLLADYPAECPPTVITLQTEPALVDTFIARMAGALKCKIVPARDGALLSPGIIHIAADPDTHAVFEPGQPPRLRLMVREPVDGARPSATLLFGTIARAGVPAVGAVLTGMGADGAKGLKLMRDAGCRTFVQDRASATVPEMPAAAVAANAAEQELALEDLISAILASCNQARDFRSGWAFRPGYRAGNCPQLPHQPRRIAPPGAPLPAASARCRVVWARRKEGEAAAAPDPFAAQSTKAASMAIRIASEV